MVNNTLKENLTNHQQALEKYLFNLEEELEYLEKSWQNLSPVYEGAAAEDFQVVWQQTLVDFKDSIEATKTLINLLKQTLEK